MYLRIIFKDNELHVGGEKPDLTELKTRITRGMSKEREIYSSEDITVSCDAVHAMEIKD